MTELKGLPNTDLYLISEVANYFRKTPRTIWNWIAAGHLTVEKNVGSTMVTRSSVISLRFNRMQKVKSKTIGIAGRLPATPTDDGLLSADSGKSKRRGRAKRV